MKKFWSYLLKKRHPHDFLSNVRYAVYGLGDSSYPQFCFVAKKLQRRLETLGGIQLIDRAEGDDQSEHGIDDTLNPWLTSLWNTLMQIFPLSNGESIISDDILEPSNFEIFSHDFDLEEPTVSYNSKLIKNTRITPEDHWQDVRHIVFDISSSGIVYEAGDVMGIKPKNSLSMVNDILKRLNCDPKQIVTIPKLGLRCSTLQEIFENYLDFQGTPKRRLFEIARNLTKSEHEKEKLDSLSKDTDELYRYCIREKKTFLEVLDEFPEINVPLEYLFDLIPLIQPRYFSISSSYAVTPKEIHITVALVSFTTPYRRLRHGFCSKWFSNMIDTETNVFIRGGSIRLPDDDTAPIVMIGPGTGVAPFKAFALSRMSRSLTRRVGRTVLFFGNRNEEKDYFYRTEWEELQNKFDFRIITAFSRDQNEKVYVQDRIRQNSHLILDCLQANGVIYVAGNAKRMPRDVREAIVDTIVEKGGLSREDALKYIRQLENKARYQCETWY
jgi:sulfite reductase alpha subunit-like flavoprotein